MIFKRFAANLRAQNWLAIAVELTIVVVGVFIGTWVANWNEERLQRAETARMVDELRPQLRALSDTFRSFDRYFKTTGAYADVAFAGFENPGSTSDRDFVVAAYQASQITSTGMNNNSWSQIFGSDRLRDLDDEQLKTDLAQLMTVDYEASEQEVFSTYRTHVRSVMPQDVQDAIRAQCGDKREGVLGYYVLPTTCNLDLPDERMRVAAARLRASPELADELRWHRAAVASFVENTNFLKEITDRALRRIEGDRK